ncbi:hypothetical protein BLS_005676 [Venturia inaequalis]|uniref:Uncharacterized protein n=1 Tax=Venturia inaequalis TaxID=5025 RepID=A0A8H3UFK0_VENIN|nr:hypothetical protein BLS_005676 [Venturia inaequalis]
MLDFSQISNQPQTCRKRKHSCAFHPPSTIRRLRAIAEFLEPFMGFKPTQAAPLERELTRKQPASNGNMSRTWRNGSDMALSSREAHPSFPTTSESPTTGTQPTVGMPGSSQISLANPTKRPSLETYRKPDSSSEVRRTTYPDGRTRTEFTFSLSGRPLSPAKASTHTSPTGRRVAWAESITRKGPRITKISKPLSIRVNGKNLRVNEASKTNVLLRPKPRQGRSVKSSALALSVCAAVVALGSFGVYAAASLDLEIQQLRALKGHQEVTIGLLKNRLDHVQRVVNEELTGNNSKLSVLVTISNVLSWAVGNVPG